MRSILMTVMLIITMVVIYQNTIGGEHGTRSMLRSSSEPISEAIETINP